jgi:glycosyltransferase involved in cell wall biosynthesis
MTQPKSLAIVVPVYNEEAGIALFCRETAPLFASLQDQHHLDIKLIFVNDGSRDTTVDVIAAQAWTVSVQVINLSRNFGKEAALTAGLAHATADGVVVMDVDLQDPPELILEMAALWQNGAKVVLAQRIDRSEDGFLKRISAQWFYKLHNRLSNIQIPYNVGDYRLMDRQVVDAVNQLPESRRFMKGLFAWVGFQPVYVSYKRPPRGAGESKFNYWKLWKLAVEGITSFSEIPLVIWTYIGAFIALSSFGYASVVVLKTLIYGVDLPGYASLITILLFLGGIQILGIGVVGEYVARIYSEVKRRPLFLVESIQTLPPKPKA